MKQFFNLLLITAFLTITGDVALAQETAKTLAMPEGKMRLPLRDVPVFSLGEIARLLREQSGKAFYVDKRVETKKLLLESPNNAATLTFGELTEAMHIATGLQWRQVDGIYFLTLYDENALIDFNRRMTAEDRKLRTDIFADVQKHVGGKIPATLDDFVKGGRAWDALIPTQQTTYFDLFQNAEKTSGRTDWTREDLTGGRIWFMFDLQIKLRTDVGTSTGGMPIFR